MPYIAVIVPHIPEGHKDAFLTAFPKIAAEIKVLPMVLGVSGGPIVEEDAVPVEDFKFLQTIGTLPSNPPTANSLLTCFRNTVFATKEDEEAF